MNRSVKSLITFLLLFTLIIIISGCTSGPGESTTEINPTTEMVSKPSSGDESALKPTDTLPPPTEVMTEEPTLEPTPEPTQTPEPFYIASNAFVDGEPIPEVYTCEGENISPALQWGGVPEGTQSLFLLVHDIDAGLELGASTSKGFVHWVVYNLPPTDEGLEEAIPPAEPLPNGALQGENDAAKFFPEGSDNWKLGRGYMGPCPPPGKEHRYVFSLYALDTKLDLPDAAELQKALDAIEGHILAETQLLGIYTK